jgi:hypothetical protein
VDGLAVQPRDYLGEERIVLTSDQLVVGVLETRDEHQLLAPAILLAEVADHRAEDPIDPRPCEGVVTEVGESEPGAHERLLDGILGIGDRVGPADREGEQPVEVRHDERFEPRAQVGRGVGGGGDHEGPGRRASRDVAGEASIAWGWTPAKRGRGSLRTHRRDDGPDYSPAGPTPLAEPGPLQGVRSDGKFRGCPTLRQFTSGSFIWQFLPRKSAGAWSSSSRASRSG